jgi:undecaprenyl-diphosphatase
MSIRALTRRRRDAVVAEEVDASAAADWSFLERLLRWDEELLLSLRQFRGSRRTALARALTWAGNGTSVTLYCLILLATFDPVAERAALRLATSAGLASLASQILKRTLGRTRPDRAIVGFEALTTDPDRFSFPSGHTSAAFAVAVAFVGAPFGLPEALFALAGAIGVSRVYLGAHYPLDVGAGAVIGLLAGAATRALLGG